MSKDWNMIQRNMQQRKGMEEQTADTAPWVDCKKYNAHKQGVDAL